MRQQPDIQEQSRRGNATWCNVVASQHTRRQWIGGGFSAAIFEVQSPDKAFASAEKPALMVQLANAGKTANGSVQVNVTLRGARPGKFASVSSQSKVISADVKIASAMQGAA